MKVLQIAISFNQQALHFNERARIYHSDSREALSRSPQGYDSGVRGRWRAYSLHLVAERIW